jgi:phospholipase D1/2
MEQANDEIPVPALRRPEPLLRPGDTCWRLAEADRFAVIIDAAEYFAAAREAMLQAQHSILMIGWDFDLRIKLVPEEHDDGAPTELGRFLKTIVRRSPRLHIRILKWDMAVLYGLARDMLPLFGLQLTTMKRIQLRFDSTHPWTEAHQQKIIVIDDALAFCGGIDMTNGRWDTCDHLPDDERRRRPDGSLAGPWHDAATLVDGAAARALGELARERWRRATGTRIRPAPSDRDIWPDRVVPDLRRVDVGIARTMPGFDGRVPIDEVERLYAAAIRAARSTIYLESQYFAANRICEEIAARLREPNGPEVVVVNPLSTAGWLEEETMGTARSLRLTEVQKADRYGRFGIFQPVNAAGEPIYVHAKVLIVDDRLIRVGSSNINNRSMGFDSECDLAVEARSAVGRAFAIRLREKLLSEHLGSTPEAVAQATAEAGSLLSAVHRLRRDTGRSLRPVPVREVNDAQEALACSHLADPERPAGPETRIVHGAKRALLRVHPAVWAGAGVLGLAALLGARRLGRGRR